jgi:hypothetical protein
LSRFWGRCTCVVHFLYYLGLPSLSRTYDFIFILEGPGYRVRAVSCAIYIPGDVPPCLIEVHSTLQGTARALARTASYTSTARRRCRVVRRPTGGVADGVRTSDSSHTASPSTTKTYEVPPAQEPPLRHGSRVFLHHISTRWPSCCGPAGGIGSGYERVGSGAVSSSVELCGR